MNYMKTQLSIKSILIITILSLIDYDVIFAQNVAIGETIFQADPSSLLELKSSERGFLITRMTSNQRDAIQNPAEALMIFNTTSQCLEIFVQGWHSIWCDTDTGFVCGNPVSDLAGNSYNTVQIGSQCWFSENLRYDNGCSNVNWENNTDVGWCGFHNQDNANVYGLLYQWSAGMNNSTDTAAQGLCPPGWRIPTNVDWSILERTVCTSGTCETDFPFTLTSFGWLGTDEGKKLKSCRTVTYGSCPTNEHPRWDEHATAFGTDLHGFSALPGGFRENSGTFSNYSTHGYWWTSTPNGANAINRMMRFSATTVFRGSYNKSSAMYIRCLKN